MNLDFLRDCPPFVRRLVYTKMGREKLLWSMVEPMKIALEYYGERVGYRREGAPSGLEGLRRRIEFCRGLLAIIPMDEHGEAWQLVESLTFTASATMRLETLPV